MKENISKALVKVTSINESQIKLDIPENSEFGDYTSNVAMILFSKSRLANSKTLIKSKLQISKFKNPRDLAAELVKRLTKDKQLMTIVDRVEVAGPGFINFYLKKEALLDTLVYISSHKDTFGYGQLKKEKAVIIEYSSPNIAKPFTIGHLRSTVIGDAIANLLEATGYQVLRDNHLGDWGTQFGKQIYAIKNWGDMAKIESADNPVKELVELYVRFHEEAEKDPSLEDEARKWFKKLEDGDEEARELWQKCIDWSWREFEKIYTRLDVTFYREFNNGRGLGESFFEDKMKPIIAELSEKGFLKEGKEGAKLVFFEGDKLPPAMIIKKDGATLYHTRDLATDKFRLQNYHPDLIINEVGIEQSLYFQQLYEIERMLGWFNKVQRKHIAHGLYRFKDRKMSTRKGEVVWLEDILRIAKDKARNLRKRGTGFSKVEESTSKTNASFISVDNDVSIGALKYNDLKRDYKQDIVFDWDEVMTMEGNSGPYLQYTYARCRSVLQKANTFDNSKIKNRKLEINNEESSLLRIFIHFPEVVSEAAEKYAPNLVCTYLYDLAQKYNTFYNSNKIIGSDNAEFRLALTEATGTTLKNGLNLLGIKAPEKM